MSGFENDVVYAKNADFSQADNQAVSEANGLATNGQMWIGTTAVNAGGTHINVGTLTSPDSSLTLGFSSPNITAQVSDLNQPVGAMQYFSTHNNTTYPNPKWLLCDGSVVAQGNYPTLYQRVGLLIEAGTNLVQNTVATITQSQNSITFGSPIFVSVGAAGTVYTSTDGITWTSRTSGTASVLRTVTYGGGLYVCGGAGGVLASSTDAITWTVRTSGTTSSINCIIYGSNLYVYAGQNGALATSTDTITWTARTNGSSSTITALAYLNNLYTSTDAITWTARSYPISASTACFYYGNNLYYAGGGSTIATSTDAITWTQYRKPVNYNLAFSAVIPFSNVLNIGDIYITSGVTNSLGTSTDGINYIAQNALGFATAPGNLAYDGVNTIVGTATGFSYTSSVYSYNTATSFKLPKQYFYNQNIQDNTFSNLYIKAL